ncbi:ShlB/FhaC/HecB family hemolysin secretion/activation protein [Hydrogenophaga sp.]|uniref:ShlB/FhaC/HecB family hemolysin secretion/activation protein n=1 Tax=Hydrogenophaga sp. TaxID=1904254 RepID=UPI003D0D53BF
MRGAKRRRAGLARRGGAIGALLLVAACGAPALAQTAVDAGRSAAAEQRRALERDALQREQALPGRQVSASPAEALPAQQLPTDESPCFTLHQVALRGERAGSFGWLLDALGGPDGLDGPLRRCLGARGVGLLVQRAQAALLARGFITSRVLLEPQDLSDGQLALTLVPGRIRRIHFAGPQTHPVLARSAVPARQGDVLNLRDIEQALENFKRVPGVEADIDIVPADDPGWSDLRIRWRQDRAVRLNLSVDDSGSRSTGRYQGSATLSIDNPLGLNDLFYVGLQGDLGGGDPGRRGTGGNSWHYSLPWGYALLSFDAGRHRYQQTVAGAAQDYTYRGRSASQAATLSWLVRRDAGSKTTLHAKAFARQSRNFIDDTEIEVQRRAVGGWQLGADHRAFVGEGTLDLGLNHRRGTGAFGALRAPEEAFGEGSSRFELLQADVRWQSPLRLGTQAWTYSGQVRAQVNLTPLGPQERFAIGGRYTVRGFDGESSLSAERGWIWRNELATPLGASGQSFFAALDHGQVSGPSSQRLVGKRLTGLALGLRGGAGALRYELFAGWPLRHPEGFRTAHTTAGFWIGTGF